jgi:hypothetical protein
MAVGRIPPADRRAALYHGLGAAGAGSAGAAPACALRSRVAISSAFRRARSASLKGVSFRGGGISCTAGYAAGVAGRAGVPSGKPPTEAGKLSMMVWLDEHPPSMAASESTATTAAPTAPYRDRDGDIMTRSVPMGTQRMAGKPPKPVQPPAASDCTYTGLFGQHGQSKVGFRHAQQRSVAPLDRKGASVPAILRLPSPAPM